MREPPKNIFAGNFLEGFRQRITELPFRARLERAQALLELGNAFLKRIEIRGVSRQMEHKGTGGFN